MVRLHKKQFYNIIVQIKCRKLSVRAQIHPYILNVWVG